jgi:predicted transcriptional regulator
MTPKAAILALVSADWTETRIAEAVGSTQPTINRIKTGKQRTCAFELGVALATLASVHAPRKGKAA